MSRHAATRLRRVLPGLLAVAALTSAALSVTAYLALAGASGGGSQCETLPPAATPSPTPSPSVSPAVSTVMLCVSVQPSEGSVARGKVAHFTVQVQALNGVVPDVSVTLTASAGTVAFTGLCPSGDGTASCQLGSLGTDVTPSLFTLSAGIRTPSSGAAWVSLAASVGAATNPPTNAQAVGIVTVTASGKSASSSPASPASSRSAAPPAAPPAAPVAVQPSTPVGTPIVAPSPTAAAASVSTAPAENVGSIMPVITPTSSALVVTASPGTSSAPAAGRSANSSGGSSLLPIVGSWVLGSLALVLAGFLAVTRNRRR